MEQLIKPEQEDLSQKKQEDLSQVNILLSPENIDILNSMDFDRKAKFTKEEMKTLLEKVFLRKEFGQDELKFFQKMIDKMLNDIDEQREISREEVVNYFDMKNMMKYMEQKKT